jgi:hypothetical protein
MRVPGRGHQARIGIRLGVRPRRQSEAKSQRRAEGARAGTPQPRANEPEGEEQPEKQAQGRLRCAHQEVPVIGLCDLRIEWTEAHESTSSLDIQGPGEPSASPIQETLRRMRGA